MAPREATRGPQPSCARQASTRSGRHRSRRTVWDGARREARPLRGATGWAEELRSPVSRTGVLASVYGDAQKADVPAFLGLLTDLEETERPHVAAVGDFNWRPAHTARLPPEWRVSDAVPSTHDGPAAPTRALLRDPVALTRQPTAHRIPGDRTIAPWCSASRGRTSSSRRSKDCTGQQSMRCPTRDTRKTRPLRRMWWRRWTATSMTHLNLVGLSV